LCKKVVAHAAWETSPEVKWIVTKKKFRRERYTLVYPGHAFKPEDLLRFVHLKPFERGWKKLGLDDDDLAALETLIMVNPRERSSPNRVCFPRGIWYRLARHCVWKEGQGRLIRGRKKIDSCLDSKNRARVFVRVGQIVRLP
jgi:hypothetical protein